MIVFTLLNFSKHTKMYRFKLVSFPWIPKTKLVEMPRNAIKERYM